jgi:hypothetical protein
VFDTLAKESMRRFSIAGDTETKPEQGKLIRAQPAPAPTTTTTTTTAVPPAADAAVPPASDATVPPDATATGAPDG